MKDVDFSYARGSIHCVYKSFLPLGALVSPFSRKLYFKIDGGSFRIFIYCA